MIDKAVLILQNFEHFKKHRTYGSIAYNSEQTVPAIWSCRKRKIGAIDRFAISKKATSVFLKKIARLMIGIG